MKFEKCDLCTHLEWCETGEKDNYISNCVLEECGFELKEVYCCNCGKKLGCQFDSVYVIKDNHYIVQAYKNIHPSENMNLFCSSDCVLEHLFVETIDLEEESHE